MTAADLNTLLNSWPQGARGHEKERLCIEMLDLIGKDMGYGALEQMAHWLYQVQCHGDKDEAARVKRERFRMLGWPLPDGFEGVAT